jgi:hypothetical protein
VKRLATQFAWRPLPHHDLLLRAALLDGDAAGEAFDSWTRTTTFDALDGGSTRLLPLLYANLTRLGVTSPLLGRVRGVARQAWYKNQLIVGRVGDVVRASHAAGLSTMVLKGVPLALVYYPHVSARPMADADVLVPPSRAAEALTLIEAEGWHARATPVDWPPRFSASCSFKHDIGVELDLHDHVLHECVAAADDEPFWAAAESIEVGGAPTLMLAPSDQLLHTFAHGFRRSTVPPIRWAADAALVIRGAEARLSWPRLLAQARRCQLTRIVATMLEYLESTLEVPLPPGLLKDLRSAPASAAERLERWSRDRPTPLRLAVEGWCDFRRTQSRDDRWRGPLGFGRYIGDRWRRPQA